MFDVSKKKLFYIMFNMIILQKVYLIILSSLLPIFFVNRCVKNCFAATKREQI